MNALGLQVVYFGMISSFTQYLNLSHHQWQCYALNSFESWLISNMCLDNSKNNAVIMARHSWAITLKCYLLCITATAMESFYLIMNHNSGDEGGHDGKP